MKIKNIPAAAFANHSAIATAGFVRVPNTQRLFTNPSFKGILFKKVGNVHQALAHGGVCFAGANSDMILLADPSSKRLGEVRCAGQNAFEVILKPGRLIRRDSSSYYACDTVRANSTNAVQPQHAPAWAMAVVTPCFGIGVVTAKATWSENRNISANSDPGYIVGSSPMFTKSDQYLLMWREFPFVANSGRFIEAAIPEISSRYPEDIRGELTKVLRDSAKAPEFARPATLALCYLSVGGKETLGHIPMNCIEPQRTLTNGSTVVQVSIYRAGDGGEPLNPGGPTDSPLEGSFPYPFLSVNRANSGIAPSGKVSLAISRPLSSLKKQLKVSRDVTLDLTKYLADYTPMTERSFEDGVVDWPDEISKGMVNSIAGATPAMEYALRLDAYAQISAPGGPDLFTDMYNVSVLAEATVAKVSVNKSGAGAVFITSDWSDMNKLPTLSNEKILNATRVPLVTGGPEGFLVAGLTGAIATVAETGMYRVTFVGMASEFKQANVAGSVKPARSRPAKVWTTEMKLYKDTGVGFTITGPRDVGYALPVRDVQFVYGTTPTRVSGNGIAQVTIRNFAENDDPDVQFHQGWNNAPFTTALKSYGHAGTAVVAAGLPCVYIEPLIDSPQ